MPSLSRTRWAKRRRHPSAFRLSALVSGKFAPTEPLRQSLIFWTMIAAPVLLWTVFTAGIQSSSPRGISPARTMGERQPVASAALWATTRPARLVYPYSVIPGGVQNVQELSDAVAHDPDVALHYASFNFHRAHIVRLAADQRMYMSYKRHGRILWTKTPHLIRAGEEVITDGKVTARKRCGNRLAVKPEGMVAPVEPSESDFSQPVAMAGDPFPPLLAQNSALGEPSQGSQGPTPGPGGFPGGIGPPIGGGVGGVVCETEAQEAAEHDHDTDEFICPKKGPKPPPPSVPEPGTYLMVGTGMALLGYRLLSKKRQVEICS